ncbi:methyltransferase domain-containing protein, partial [Candidatus Pelagibacter sp.]|nr:methyltransferase domain-containing protein [Candidatus Pelagibacter sp.]
MTIDFKKKTKYIIRKKCVLCGSSKLTEVLNFKKTPLANSYLSNKNSDENSFPLVCLFCDQCSHLQLKHLINPKLMFENYLYVTGTSPVLVKHFENYYYRILQKKKLNKKKHKILDIACNDGTFLNFFKKNKFKNVVGIEPAKNLRYINKKKNIDINSIFFSYKKSFNLKNKYNSFDIITANNVFAHVPDLKDFSKGVKNILSKDGLFIFEVSYLKNVIEKLTFDTIYHEHMSYHSLYPLINFFSSINLKVLDFDLIEAQGGSIRVFVGHADQKAKTKKIKKQ